MNFISTTDGLINGGLGDSWKVVLNGSNGTLHFNNFSGGSKLKLLLQEDSVGLGYKITWPTNPDGSNLFVAGNPPTRDTSANAISLYEFVTVDGSNWHDMSGAPSRLPARMGSAFLGLMVGVALYAGAQGALQTVHLSRGAGTAAEMGRLQDVRDVYANGTGSISGTGALAGTPYLGSGVLLNREDGSGSYVTSGFGGFGVGSGSSVKTTGFSGAFVKMGIVGRGLPNASGALTVTGPQGGKGGHICFLTPSGAWNYLSLMGGKLITGTGTVKDCYFGH